MEDRRMCSVGENIKNVNRRAIIIIIITDQTFSAIPRTILHEYEMCVCPQLWDLYLNTKRPKLKIQLNPVIT
ncbi:hypothetical protein FKM82_025199 [Ascaphus truei]